MRVPRVLFGTMSAIEAFVALYVGFFFAYSLYEVNRGVTRHRVLELSGVSSEKLVPSLSKMGKLVINENYRGIWIDRTSLPTSRKECSELTERLAELDINAIFPETFARTAAVCFDSQIAPHDDSYNDGNDMLAILIEEAHARGIEVHAWCWCMCAGTAYRPGPKVLENDDWLGLNMGGRKVSKTGTFWLCPHSKPALNYLKSVFVELAQRYNIDGINMDYIRVEENHKEPYCMCDTCRDKYFAYADAKRTVSWPPRPRDPSFLRWRVGMLDSFVEDVSDTVRSVKPDIKVSACVLPLARQAKRLEGQNWRAWLTDGYLDFACALTYTDKPHRNKKWNSVVSGHREDGLDLIPSLGLHLCKTRGELAALMLADSMAAKLGGVMLFSLRDIPPAVERTLQTGTFDPSKRVAMGKIKKIISPKI